MKRFLVFVAHLLVAFPVVAQELPFTIGCLANEEKPLEMELCQAVFIAAHTHEFIRESTQDDYSSLMLWVVPVQSGPQLAVAAQLNLSSRSFGLIELAVNTGCYFVPAEEIVKYATAIIARAYQNAPKDLSIFEPARVEQLQLEASPP